MKRFRLLILCFVIATVTLLTSCGADNRLDTPSGVKIEYDTLMLEWGAVDGAKVYSLRIEPEGQSATEITVSRNFYSLSELAPGNYSITVKAIDNSGESEDSLPTKPIEFTRDEECGLSFKLINGGKEYAVSDKGSATGAIVIPDTYRKKPVVAIGEKAFFGKSDVTSVTLPEGIRSIGDFAFANCSYLTKINLPDSLVSLGESAFSGCRILEGELKLPNSLTDIPKGAFAYCSSLDGVIFGDGVSSIGEDAFTDCSKIKSLSFPASLTSIGDFAFAACASVETVSFNSGLVSIGEFAFSKAVSLPSVTIPDSVKTVGAGAFYNCSSLSDVTLGVGVETLGHSAFLETKLYKECPTNEIYVGKWFVGLKDNTALYVNFRADTVGIANNAFFGNQYVQSIELPDSTERIGALAFAESNLVSVVTGSGVKYVGDQAFYSCDKLVTALLGSFDYISGSIKESSLISIGDYAFTNCSFLERIEIPETVRDIGSYAFRNTGIYLDAATGAVYADNWLVDFNENLKEELTVYPGTVGIARYALYNNRTLKSVNIPNTVKTIGRGAFYNCTSLLTVKLPDALEEIADYTFYGCSSLRVASLPPMLEKIGRSAFYMCGTVKDYATDTENDTLTIPAGVSYIGDFAFFGCGYRAADGLSGETETGGIDIIVIGDSVEYIGKCAFYGFASLKSVSIGAASVIGDKAFYKCPSLEVVKMPDTLEKIGDYAFYKCEALTECELGDQLLSIGDYAFSGNKALESIVLPPTVVSIGTQAFRDCDAIKTLFLGNSLAEIGTDAFYSCDNLTLYSSLDGAALGWSKTWNSTFSPVVWGCELSENGDYVYALSTKDGFMSNNFVDTVLSEPSREGYSFLGWSLTENDVEAEYATTELSGLQDGTRLYSVWSRS